MWVAAEMRQEELRVLTELTHAPGSIIRAAAEVADQRRRTTAEITIRHVFAVLALTPRVPPPLIANVFLAFIDGLVAAYRRREGDGDDGIDDARPAYDVLWLALLSLGD